MMLLVTVTGCQSEAKKTMKNAVETANEVLEKAEKPYDQVTQDNLKKAIESVSEAQDDDAYTEVTKNIESALKDYTDSVKQLKQVTNPTESFLV